MNEREFYEILDIEISDDFDESSTTPFTLDTMLLYIMVKKCIFKVSDDDIT
jgi:hypothetical protein